MRSTRRARWARPAPSDMGAVCDGADGSGTEKGSPVAPAAELPDQLSKEVVQERYERLLRLVNQIALEENQKQIGNTVEVLVGAEGRKDDQTARLSGRARDNRLVHFEVPEGQPEPRPGDLVTCTVTSAAPYHLIADLAEGGQYTVRKTIAGDAWDRQQAESCSTDSHSAAAGSVSLNIGTKPKR